MAGCSSPLLLLLLLLGATSWASGALARTSWKKIKSLEAPAHRPLPQRLLSFVPRPLVSRPKKKEEEEKKYKNIYIRALPLAASNSSISARTSLSLSFCIFPPPPTARGLLVWVPPRQRGTQTSRVCLGARCACRWALVLALKKNIWKKFS